MKIKEIYENLENEYEKQGWWPHYQNKTFIYNSDKPMSSMQRFFIIISAILTQNTSWDNVEKAIKNLDKFNFLRKDAIKQLPEKELAILIKSSGYYNQKAKKIKFIIDFLDSKKEVNRENLLEIWGIGKETADSILLYAYNKPIFVIDAFTTRIMKRLGFEFKDYDELQKMFMDDLEKDYNLFNEFHALFVKHGKEICKKNNPECGKCCLKKECKFKGAF